MYDDIRIDTPWGIQNGLLGIGWGLEYFMQKGFVECDSNDILTELDNKIIERDLRRVKDYSFDTGIEGLAWYVLIRLLSSERYLQKPFDKMYLDDLRGVCENVPNKVCHPGISLLLDYLVGKQIDDLYLVVLGKITSQRTDGEKKEALLWVEGLKYLLR